MSQMIDFTLPSCVPGRTLHAFRCVPEGRVRAVLQLSHGMVEFIDRYKPLAEHLAGQGILVTGHDHLGHGGSIRTKDDYGFFAQPDGNRAVLNDLHALTVLTKQLYPGVPYFLLGHSMGSFYARQNLQDMLTQQAVCTNGYLALDVLKKTGREMMNGCSRVATTGMSALAVAQTVARATGNQIKVMDMLSGVNSTIENLIAETGRQLNTHVDKTTQFAQNPMVGIDKLKEMFDQTFKAMDAMDDFRSQAIVVMGQNNAMVSAEIARAEQYIDKVRVQKAQGATSAQLAGPVKL